MSFSIIPSSPFVYINITTSIIISTSNTNINTNTNLFFTQFQITKYLQFWNSSNFYLQFPIRNFYFDNTLAPPTEHLNQHLSSFSRTPLFPAIQFPFTVVMFLLTRPYSPIHKTFSEICDSY